MKVFWNQGYFGPARGQLPGAEVRVNCTFDWAGEKWLVPSVYVCGQGLVVDLMRPVAWERMQAFIDRWNLTEKTRELDFTKAQRRHIEREHPLENHCRFHAEVNGRALRATTGSGFTYMMELSDGDPDALELLEHYDLSKDCAWSFYRQNFEWATKRKPKMRSLTLNMVHDSEEIPGMRFVFDGEKDLNMTHPVTGQALTLKLYEENDVQTEGEDGGWMKRLMYGVEPEPAHGEFSIEDAGYGEIRQRWIGWIGGCWNAKCVYSAMYNEKPQSVTWQTLFHVKRVEDMRVRVL